MRSPRSWRSGSRHEPAAPGFACEGSTLAATLDEAGGGTGLLIVWGGNELRSGAWSGQAQLAARIAAAGFPVLRFDRRGWATATGRTSASATARRYRRRARGVPGPVPGAHPRGRPRQLRRGVRADAGRRRGLRCAGAGQPLDHRGRGRPARRSGARALRRRLADPAAIRRLLTGQVSVGKLLPSLLRRAPPLPAALGLRRQMASAIAVTGAT